MSNYLNRQNPMLKPPYFQMQEVISDIIELYHNELRNINMYQPLLALAPNMEEEEIIKTIIDHTNDNSLYLSEIYVGLTGDTIDTLSNSVEEMPAISYTELLKNVLFSKTDTLEQYESVYRAIPMQPYKDLLFEIIISQLQDATSANYLLSAQTKSKA